MKKDIGDHIISKLDLQDIAKVLSDELSGFGTEHCFTRDFSLQACSAGNSLVFTK